MKRARYPLMAMVFFLVTVVRPLGVEAMEPSVDSVARVISGDKVDVRFRVKVLGYIPVAGRFDRLHGTLVSSRDGRSGTVRMRIETSSVNTHDDWRDDYLRGPTFFASERYPHIIFSGTCHTINANGSRQLAGVLSLHGKTKHVVFDVRPVAGEGENRTGVYQAKTRINRSDFGLDSLKHLISDEVEIVVAMRTN